MQKLRTFLYSNMEVKMKKTQILFGILAYIYNLDFLFTSTPYWYFSDIISTYVWNKANLSYTNPILFFLKLLFDHFSFHGPSPLNLGWRGLCILSAMYDIAAFIPAQTTKGSILSFNLIFRVVESLICKSYDV